MRLLSSLAITIALTAPVLAQTPTPAPSAAQAQATQELNEAAREYREQNFAAAQAHSERALQFDPQNKSAPFFVARTIHAQYKPGDFTPENVAKAREAIIGYQRILERWPADDECYKAIAYLYGAIKEDELLREWIVQRAGNASLANDKRAEAFVVLASRDWDCSFKITEQPRTKVTTVSKNKAYVRYKMPKDYADFERAKECANHGLEMTNMAVALMPEDVSAWTYRTNIFLELVKLAEMSRDTYQKAEFRRQYEEALDRTAKLSPQAQSKP